MKKTFLFLLLFSQADSLFSQNVGIGTTTPTSKLNVNGQVTIDQKNFGGFGGLLIKGNAPGNNYPNIGFSITNISSADVVAATITGQLINNSVGSEAIDLSFETSQSGLGGLSEKMRIRANGNIGIGTSTPGFPLNFSNNLGDKISLYGNTGSHYGFGIQSGLLQVYTDAPGSHIAFGYGSSGSFTERMRILNTTGYDGMSLNGRLILRNGTTDPAGAGGVWLTRADNAALLGFMGTQNNQNIGFYGGPANGGWGFIYDAINSRVGIGINNPNAPLAFAPSLGKKITLYPGATGDVGFGVAGNRLQIYSDNPNADVAIGYDAAGTFNERFAVKPNGALAVNGNTGTNGQVLKSSGSGSAATWVSATNEQYNRTAIVYGTGMVSTNAPFPEVDIPGLVYNFTVTGNAKLMINFNIFTNTPACLCGYSIMDIRINLDGSQPRLQRYQLPNGLENTVTGSALVAVGPGSHTIKITAGVFGSAVEIGSGVSTVQNNIIVQVIPE